MTIPFDNTLHASKGLAVWNDVEENLDVLFKTHVLDKQGGVCHQLNGLFRGLIKELGFEVTVLSAAIRGPDNNFGLDLEHMMNCVRVGEDLWLTDVGFVGPSFLDPIRLTDEVQCQYGCYFRVVEDGEYHIVEREAAEGSWQGVYRFRQEPRELSDWVGFAQRVTEDTEIYWEGELVSTGTLIRGRSFENGQRILIGRRHMEVRDGVESVSVLAKQDKYEQILRKIIDPIR